VLRELKETLGGRSADPLRRINRDVFTSHRDRLLVEGCSPTTCNHAFKTLADVSADALKDQLIESNFSQLKALKPERFADAERIVYQANADFARLVETVGTRAMTPGRI
jgi:hypothetical protein